MNRFFVIPIFLILLTSTVVNSAFSPNFLPKADAANANLFVSAENSQFQNYYTGAMVIEVVVIDADIKDVDQGRGEPDVTVNGQKLRMIQAADGNWYAYFADRIQAQTADQTVVGNAVGQGLDFGQFCGKNDGDEVLGFSVSETVGITLPTAQIGSTDGTATIADEQCTIDTSLTDARINNVVRENKTVNPGNLSVPIGQIGFLNQNVKGQNWPFIQLYDFNPTGNVVVQYNKGGSVQSTTLIFDISDQFANLVLDRSTYPRGSQVHVTITDWQLNIDPTDEDSWTFQTNYPNTTTAYQVFNEQGGQAGDGVAKGVIDISSSLFSLMFEDNGMLRLNVDTQASGTNIVTIQDNADGQITYTPTSSTLAQDARTVGSGTSGRNTINTQPITITELASNGGIFGTYDESDISTLKVTNNAPRGKSATIDYNDNAKTILVGFGFGFVNIQLTDAEWNSGEEIPVVINDVDANKNTKEDEDMDLFNPNVEMIPSLSTGDPFTLGESGVESINIQQALFYRSFAVTSLTNGKATSTIGDPFGKSILPIPVQGDVTVQKFSERALITPNKTATVGALIFDLETTADELRKSINDPRSSTTPRFHGFNLINIDLRGINPAINDVDIWLLNSTSADGIIKKNINGKFEEVPFSTTGSLGTFTALSLANGATAQQLILLNDTTSTTGTAEAQINQVVANLFNMKSTDRIGLLFNFTAINTDTSVKPIAADFFSFGYFNDGTAKADRVNNQIIRIEAEETGNNTNVFAGTLEFVMLNQLNILDSATYAGLNPIDDDPVFVVHQDLINEFAPRVNYNDLGADGVITQIADQENASTHTGTVNFDKVPYNVGETVIVTLNDQDLNTDADLIDIYTVVNKTGDIADSTVGKSGLPQLSNGDALGRLLEITFDDMRWIDTNNACSAQLRAEGIIPSLYETGFVLIEAGTTSGVFTGDYQVPIKICKSNSGSIYTPGLDMQANYVDFRGGAGEVTAWFDTGVIQQTNTPPIIDVQSVHEMNELTTLSFTATATDADIPPQTLTFSLVGSPLGAVINSTSGVFTWTPSESQQGIHIFSVQVSDGILTDTNNVAIIVKEVNVTPILDPIGPKTVDELTTLSFTATATDADIPPQTLTFSLVGSPLGAVINSTSGVFTWTPSESQQGIHTLNVTTSDGSLIDSELITITVTEPVQLFCGKPQTFYSFVFFGTELANRIIGTGGNDLLVGNGGNDSIIGKAGNDCLIGGDGNDKIWGGRGLDYIEAGAGNDVVHANQDDDTVFGGDGNDLLGGGLGNDIINGGQGNDSIFGRAGNDKLNGNEGDDTIQGGQGDDTIDGGPNFDNCHGSTGMNSIINCEKTKRFILEQTDVE